MSSSFRDVVALRTFVYLRSREVPLQRVRKAVQSLRDMGATEQMVDILAAFRGIHGREVVPLYRPKPGLVVDPEICGGYPVVAGTRAPYDLIASLLEDGVSAEKVAGFYPAVSPDAARGALAFARYVDGYREPVGAWSCDEAFA